MLDQTYQPSKRPYAVMGSGDLVSHLDRQCSGGGIAQYRFNVFRIGGGKQVTHSLRPCDLQSLVKLCQVLAFALADDGWHEPNARQQLYRLARELDEITQEWDEEKDGCATTP